MPGCLKAFNRTVRVSVLVLSLIHIFSEQLLSISQVQSTGQDTGVPGLCPRRVYHQLGKTVSKGSVIPRRLLSACCFSSSKGKEPPADIAGHVPGILGGAGECMRLSPFSWSSGPGRERWARSLECCQGWGVPCGGGPGYGGACQEEGRQANSRSLWGPVTLSWGWGEGGVVVEGAVGQVAGAVEFRAPRCQESGSSKASPQRCSTEFNAYFI